jgi:hypothetical protein
MIAHMKALTLCFISAAALAQTVPNQGPAPTVAGEAFPLYVKVQLDKSVKLSSLKAGEVTNGNLARDVYSADRKPFPAGSPIRLTVDHLERKRRAPNDRWPWLVKLFLPRHETSPAFRDAVIELPDGSESRLRVSLISASRKIEIHALPAKRRRRHDQTASRATAASAATPSDDSYTQLPLHSSSLGPILYLEGNAEGTEVEAGNLEPAAMSRTSTVVLPSGTICRILLLNTISASKSNVGDAVQARLLEPVELDSHIVLPAGSIFHGSVLKATPPRWLSRSGSLALTFSALTLPDRSRIPVSASLTDVELNRGAHTKIDAEGRLLGDRPGVVWMLINGGATAGIAKEVDDGTQLVMEAILSGATDASTAGTARIAGTIVSGIFMLTRHGRDVILPSHTEMNIVLNRPLALSRQVPAPIPTR